MDRDYHQNQSGKQRSSHRPSEDSLYAPPFPSSQSSSTRPILPPIDPRMPYSYRTQSPPRFDDQQVSYPLWNEPRGMPSQPAPAPSYSYDLRYPPTNAYPPANPFPDQRSRLPPLTLNVDYLPRQSPSSSYPYPPAHARAASSYYPPPASSPRPAYTQAASVPFASAEWSSAPVSPPDLAHRQDPYGTATYSPYPPQDREPWPSGGTHSLVSPGSDRGESSEPLVKKKRKRADANQLRVLNATYQRTAFPSTQEREQLAKELDMSPRSVQIWFQNKRQSMRQSRNVVSNLPPILHHTYASPTPAEPRSSHHSSYHPIESSSRRREQTPEDHHRRR